MTRKRVFTKMVSAGEAQPAIRITFKGKYQSDYFSLRKIAEEEFQVTQTGLARVIISDWLKRYRDLRREGNTGATEQLVLSLMGEKKIPAGSAG